MSESVQNTPEHRHVEFRDIPLVPCLVEIRLPDKKITVGRALMLHNGSEAVLWHISVAKKYRRKGFATGLIENMKSRWNEIKTDMENNDGRNLCLQCGFEEKDSGVFRLVWKRSTL